ncbi:YdbL family protein [Shewanella baltica]|uniref:YdbL family protein n=1 Tax=Shewanella baltica TaxID=62322 RepID=UPI00217D3612|nr:YdbL family protein [Shewanella baltica]MCS6097768.1 YdbL family protein [Shewanella baltica]MCS6123292.1 YdbL family protein [Shewanella baltica]MCS6179903.1 YdbL family protein [Shewanella baltica]MCS6228876.1 YdbL family protein [Shewanella baltica]MCS6256013.1 YdbL family protein [Shewanella baltica]
MKSIRLKTKLILLLTLSFLSLSAFAMSLQEAKSQGYLGEQANGYLGLVQANPEAKAVMDDVNNKRRAHYETIAKKNKLSSADVAKLAGEKAIAATDKGNYVQDAKGKWIKK